MTRIRERLGRWRWRCALCIGFGFADSQDHAVDDFERHYHDKHRQEST